MSVCYFRSPDLFNFECRSLGIAPPPRALSHHNLVFICACRFWIFYYNIVCSARSEESTVCAIKGPPAHIVNELPSTVWIQFYDDIKSRTSFGFGIHRQFAVCLWENKYKYDRCIPMLLHFGVSLLCHRPWEPHAGVYPIQHCGDFKPPSPTIFDQNIKVSGSINGFFIVH